MVRISVEPLDVDLAKRALPRPNMLLKPGYELGAQDVDLPVQEPAAVRDLALLLDELADQVTELLVGERAQIWKCFHGASRFEMRLHVVKQRNPNVSTLG